MSEHLYHVQKNNVPKRNNTLKNFKSKEHTISAIKLQRSPDIIQRKIVDDGDNIMDMPRIKAAVMEFMVYNSISPDQIGAFMPEIVNRHRDVQNYNLTATLRELYERFVSGAISIAPKEETPAKLLAKSILDNPPCIVHYDANELAARFKEGRSECIVGPSTKGSRKSTIIKIQNNDITMIEIHPGGGRHNATYYRISSSSRGTIKVVTSPRDAYEGESEETDTTFYWLNDT